MAEGESDGPVHWEIARQVARWVALEGGSEPAVAAAERARLSEVSAAATPCPATTADPRATHGPSQAWVKGGGL